MNFEPATRLNPGIALPAKLGLRQAAGGIRDCNVKQHTHAEHNGDT